MSLIAEALPATVVQAEVRRSAPRTGGRTTDHAVGARVRGRDPKASKGAELDLQVTLMHSQSSGSGPCRRRRGCPPWIRAAARASRARRPPSLRLPLVNGCDVAGGLAPSAPRQVPCDEATAGESRSPNPQAVSFTPARAVLRRGAERRGRGWKRRPVLFLCTGNRARSQIAEALVRHLAAGSVRAFSAGSDPKPLHPNAVRVIRARGIDLAGRRSKPIGRFDGRRFDYVVSLCDRVRELCPEFPEYPRMIHWSVADPARERDSDEQSVPAFERTAAELAERIPFLLELIQHNLPSQEVT